MRKRLLYLCGLCLSGILTLSCNNDKDAEVPMSAQLIFAFDFNVAGEPLEFGTPYEINETVVSFEATNFYIGGLIMQQQNGVTISLDGQYLLAGLGNTATINTPLDISDITNVKFFVGVDSITNAQSEADFTSRPASDPLSIKDPDMHWNWMTGYKFIRVDGDADTDGDGEVDTGVAYHIGSDPFLKRYDINKILPLSSGQNTLYFTLDLAEFFNGVDLSTELDTHTSNNLPLAQRLFDNMSTAISVRSDL